VDQGETYGEKAQHVAESVATAASNAAHIASEKIGEAYEAAKETIGNAL